MTLDATHVQLSSRVDKTSPEILRRYQENRNWRYFPKEWIYRNAGFAGKDVLDFGCGTGEITTQLALLGARKVHALDVTPGLVEATRKRAELDGVLDKVELHTGFIQDLEPRPVDIVIAFAVLHHCFPLENVIPELMRWLKPGGTFIATEPVVHLAFLEYLRNHSGVEGDPLDEGERKLNPDDLRYVMSHLSEPKLIPFHMLGRLTRKWKNQEMLFLRADQALFHLPLAWKLSGQVILIGKRR